MSNGIATTTLGLLRDIVKQEMNLKDDRINIYNQKFDIPDDDGLQVFIEYKYSKPYANRNYAKIVDGNYQEVQSLNTQEQIIVGVYSRNLDALNRKEEVVMALLSTYSQQTQEKNSFQIARIAPIQDLSFVEGAGILYRFDIAVTVLAWYEKVKTQVPYDSFDVTVRVNDGQPDLTAEFEQPLVDPA